MPGTIERVGIIAEVASAIAAIAYPVVKGVSRYIAHRRAQEQQRISAAAALVEARLTERCTGLERRLVDLEHSLRDAA